MEQIGRSVYHDALQASKDSSTISASVNELSALMYQKFIDNSTPMDLKSDLAGNKWNDETESFLVET